MKDPIHWFDLVLHVDNTHKICKVYVQGSTVLLTQPYKVSDRLDFDDECRASIIRSALELARDSKAAGVTACDQLYEVVRP